jgi:LysR family transcriptional regulator, hypochlorite-specific transcription factor HypT
MELKWLEDYLMLAREGSFSRAASLRNVTQPAFSRRIRALEDWLGATLFDRSSTPVTLTRHGEEFQKHARQIVEEALAVRADFRLAQRADDQLVRIVALNSISVTVAPGLIAAYRANRPKGRVELISLQGLDTHYDALDAGAAHVLLAFGRAPGGRKAAHYEELTLRQDAFVPVATPAFTAARGGVGLPAGKGPLPVAAYGLFSFSHGFVAEPMERLRRERPLDVVLESALSEAHKAVALQGLALVWLPESLAAAELRSGELVTPLGAEYRVPMAVRAIRRADLSHPAALAFWRSLAGNMPHRHVTTAPGGPIVHMQEEDRHGPYSSAP